MSPPRPERHDRLVDRIGRDAERKRRARRERRRTVWFGLGTFGLVGWAVSVPMVIGVLVGRWLDGRVHGNVSWTVTGLVVGVVLGCVNAWYWVRRESSDD
ncbi:MAG TPA: AtpZ/AtpI family protein [Gemmatimonadales bacterium]|nr:AtpZ/AtpI family protein [Gemmatimonadales bacterium]